MLKNINIYFVDIKIRFIFVALFKGRTTQPGGFLELKITEMKKYTTKEINMNFRIKVYGFVNGVKVNTLVGVKGLIKMVGDLAEKLVTRAFNSTDDVCVCKLRRGLKVSFYCK